MNCRAREELGGERAAEGGCDGVRKFGDASTEGQRESKDRERKEERGEVAVSG